MAYATPPEFRVVDVMGWIHMDEAWEAGVPSSYDSEGTRLVSPQHLIPIGGDDGLE